MEYDRTLYILMKDWIFTIKRIRIYHNLPLTIKINLKLIKDLTTHGEIIIFIKECWGKAT
jgi:hypothetical protein